MKHSAPPHPREIDRVRQFFVGLESLVREARQTNDPRVLITALRVLSLQSRNLRELLAEVDR